MMVIEKDFLSVKEFAQLVGVHYNTVIRSIQKGRLSAFRISGGRKSAYRIPRTEIHRIAFMDMKEMMEKIMEEKK